MFETRILVSPREAALVRWLPRALRAAAALLLPWIVVLAMTVKGHFGARNLSNSWVWLDVIEVTALLTLAALIRRRHPATSPIASATAVLLALDAFFDLWSAHRGSAYQLAQVLAYCAELPTAALLAAVSWYSLAWVAGRTLVPAHSSGTATGGSGVTPGMAGEFPEGPRRTDARS